MDNDYPSTRSGSDDGNDNEQKVESRAGRTRAAMGASPAIGPLSVENALDVCGCVSYESIVTENAEGRNLCVKQHYRGGRAAARCVGSFKEKS